MRHLLWATSSLSMLIAVALAVALTWAWRRARRGAPIAITATLVLAPLACLSLGVALLFRPLGRLPDV